MWTINMLTYMFGDLDTVISRLTWILNFHYAIKVLMTSKVSQMAIFGGATSEHNRTALSPPLGDTTKTHHIN